MVELLSSQFESVFTDEDQCGIALLQPPLLTRATVGELVNISRDLVQTYIPRIKTNKAEGPDEINERVLRECEKEISLPLGIISSRSLAEAKIPLD